MRESISGTWLLGFVLVFIVLFAAYLAVSINYTKAFKVKNRIINIIEENEGYTEDPRSTNFESIPKDVLKTMTTTDAKIYYYLKDIGYPTDNINSTNADKCFDGDSDAAMQGGYCVKKICSGKGAYYKVETFIKFELPLINFQLLIPVNGETKVLYHTQDGDLVKCPSDDV